MRKPKRSLITFNEEDREIINAVRGRVPFATWVRERAVSSANHFLNKRHHTHNSLNNQDSTTYDFSNSQE